MIRSGRSARTTPSLRRTARKGKSLTWYVCPSTHLSHSDCQPQRDFHPELQAAFEELKIAIAKGLRTSFIINLFTNQLAESWELKCKFPASLKPILADVALRAVRLGEYDDDFFSLMPVLFPYNRFTMTVRVLPFPIQFRITDLSTRNSSRGPYFKIISRF